MITPIRRDFTAAAQQEVIPDIGQMSKADRRLLDRAVRAGTLAKWRGHWFPVAGAPFGIGPLKTCYGPVDHPYAPSMERDAA